MIIIVNYCYKKGLTTLDNENLAVLLKVDKDNDSKTVLAKPINLNYYFNFSILQQLHTPMLLFVNLCIQTKKV